MTAGSVGADLMARLDALAALSEEPGRLVRRFLTPAHAAANRLVGTWMSEAGMAVRIDAIGNVIGRYEGNSPEAPALLLGSHLDTIVDAGRYDGMLGVVTAIACVEHLRDRGIRLPCAIEVVGFADEEGTRFGATLLGSRALAGTFDRTVLERPDEDGVTMAEALRAFGLEPARIGEVARTRGDTLAYLELHIEQGPVLEALGLAAGCVTAISGATRTLVALSGMAGHAGTVPMAGRRDALAGAAQCVLAVEDYCRGHEDIVGTVGRIACRPGATNVIPGEASFSLDLRSPDDAVRRRAQADLVARFEAIARSRALGFRHEINHDADATRCATWLMDRIDAALERHGIRPHRLPSGAGHDGMALAHLTDIGMIFIRCRGGISHHPDEAITAADAETGYRVLLDVLTGFDRMPAPRG